jgi:GGDEF domain-containing protein
MQWASRIGGRFSQEHAKVARIVANKVDLLNQQFNCSCPDFLLRDEFLGIIDETLSRLPGSPHTVLYVDVDKTYLINDSFGHEIGDDAIRAVSKLLRQNAGRDQFITHLLGDRFAVLLCCCAAVLLSQSDSDAALSRAEHIFELLAGWPGRLLGEPGRTVDLPHAVLPLQNSLISGAPGFELTAR